NSAEWKRNDQQPYRTPPSHPPRRAPEALAVSWLPNLPARPSAKDCPSAHSVTLFRRTGRHSYPLLALSGSSPSLSLAANPLRDRHKARQPKDHRTPPST